ncbi:ribonuclease H-like domain-containing protein [Trichoderma austrokoningii]
MAKPRPTPMVDTVAAMSALIDSLKGLPREPPSIYVDLEGVNLSRHGTISILQLYICPANLVYLIDVLVLQEKSFSTPATVGRLTLKDILESRSTPKVFFDVRNDSDALYSHFRIKLAGVIDLQLWELAARPFAGRFVKGLAKCIEDDSSLSDNDKFEFLRAKEKGKSLFSPEHGGSYAVFNERPLSKDILDYCAQDVYILPDLLRCYAGRCDAIWEKRVAEASRSRVAQSQRTHYNGKGAHMALAPADWYYKRQHYASWV